MHTREVHNTASTQLPAFEEQITRSILRLHGVLEPDGKTAAVAIRPPVDRKILSHNRAPSPRREEVHGLTALWAGTTNPALLRKRNAQVQAKKQTKLGGSDVQAQGSVWDAGRPGTIVWLPFPKKANPVATANTV